jgi:hypothetical protein
MVTNKSMTKIIIAGIIGLLAGYGVGNFGETTTETVDEMRGKGMGQMQAVEAEDYVSMRPLVASLPDEVLSAAETEDLLFMREEEKLARDVYISLYDKWGLQIFSNISQSEQTHTEAIRDLIEKYDLTDPVADDTVGVFVNEELAALYEDLVAQGSESEVAALTVGALIEDLDIKDLADAIERTDNEDIALVYENLQRGSRNHLRSFTRQLDMRGESYTPAYISADEYEAIIGGEQERGGGAGHGWGGRGSGNGGGKGQGRN